MQFTPRDFATLFGVSEEELPAPCRALAMSSDLRYELPDAKSRDEIVLDVIRQLDSDSLARVGPERAGIWESCWSENLRKFVDAGYDPEGLTPDFIKPGRPIRLNR